jgi:hypothetical protein
MTSYIDAWRQAIADHAKAARNRRGHYTKRESTSALSAKAGMIRKTPPSAHRCSALNGRLRQCGLEAAPGSIYCQIHQPKQAA